MLQVEKECQKGWEGLDSKTLEDFVNWLRTDFCKPRGGIWGGKLLPSDTEQGYEEVGSSSEQQRDSTGKSYRP